MLALQAGKLGKGLESPRKVVVVVAAAVTALAPQRWLDALPPEGPQPAAVLFLCAVEI